MMRISLLMVTSFAAFFSGNALAQPQPTKPVNSQSTQWVQAAGPSFPALPPAVVQASEVSITDPGRISGTAAGSVGASNQSVQGHSTGLSQNGVAPLAPLLPPGEMMFETAKQIISPFTADQIEKLHGTLDQNRRAMAIPSVQAMPELRSVSVNLSPGASLPVLRTMPGETSTLVFLDSTGGPWPLAAPPRIANENLFSAEWLQDSSVVVVSAKTFYEQGNLAVFLKGLTTPVIVKLVSGEPRSHAKTRAVDYRLDLRVPGRGPNALAPVVTQGQIALYDSTMQAFLDGIPPEKAKVIQILGSNAQRTQAWQLEGALYLRTPLEMETAFDQTIGAADGTRVYKLSPTPFVMLSELGHPLQLQLGID